MTIKYISKYISKSEETQVKRQSGVLMHISSLPGEYSCGSFGRAAKEFVDFLSDAEFSYWQVLPFGLPDFCGSPYKSVSAFAGNPYFIDLDILFEKGLLTRDELESQKQWTPYVCDFAALYKRYSLFGKIAQRVSYRSDVERFISENPQLGDFCRFMALKAANGQKAWWEWTEHSACDENILFMHKFLQYEFFTQWEAVRKYANSRGIKIIGDMPIYVDTDSSDVYFDRDNFLLGKENKPCLVAGVPPDYFAPEGQLWGNPIYNWDRMKEDGYSWWIRRMKHTMRLYDAVRIDHFRAFSSYYGVSADAKNAKNGKWYRGPGLEFVELIKRAADGGMIIAEDLGDIDEGVVQLVKDSGLPGMRVFQFGFDGYDDTHRPHAYPENCVAYSGTHDNNTLLGYLWELETNKKRFMLEYCDHNPEQWQSAVKTIIKTIMRSHAAITVFPIQDLLGYGGDTRMNRPGRPEGNWAFRITREQLASINRAEFAGFNRRFSRSRNK